MIFFYIRRFVDGLLHFLRRAQKYLNPIESVTWAQAGNTVTLTTHCASTICQPPKMQREIRKCRLSKVIRSNNEKVVQINTCNIITHALLRSCRTQQKHKGIIAFGSKEPCTKQAHLGGAFCDLPLRVLNSECRPRFYLNPTQQRSGCAQPSSRQGLACFPRFFVPQISDSKSGLGGFQVLHICTVAHEGEKVSVCGRQLLEWLYPPLRF